MKCPFFLPLVLAAATLLPISVHATERRFTYVQEVTTTPKGTFEFENWVTWKNRQGDFNDLNIRQELEYGVTDQFQIAAYFDWSALDNNEKDHHVRFDDVALEAKLNLSNPVTDFIGSGLYAEVKLGDRVFEIEGKLLLQKNFGPLMIAYNAIAEAGWEGSHLDEETGKFAQTLGVSYEVTPNFAVGAELLHEIEFPNWNFGKRGHSPIYVGPNTSLRYGNFFVTMTPMIQLTDIEEKPDVQIRLITGFVF